MTPPVVLSAHRGPNASRRGALAVLAVGFAEVFWGCASAPPPPPSAPLPPLLTSRLADLCTGAGLLWLILVKPREIAQIPWLIPDIGLFASEARLDAFQKDAGFDLRQIPEALLARFDETLGDADLQLARHNADPDAITRLFGQRIVKGYARATDRPDVVRIGGLIGTAPHTFGRIGSDVVGFQEGGSVDKGPLRVAMLYAESQLKRTPRALETEPLKSLVARFGAAPFIALAKGPFTDEWKRAAKGLLEVATAVGAAARPTARENLGIALAITGDFHGTGGDASDVLVGAWNDFAATEMGVLLGLDRPIEPPLPSHTDEVVALAVELDPHRFAKGLHALVSEDLDAVMKL